MTDVLRFSAPGPWVTRNLRLCVLASDYDALVAELAEAHARIRELEAALRRIANSEFDSIDEGVTAQGIARTALDREGERHG